MLAGDVVLRIEEIQLRGATTHEEEDDTFGLRDHAGDGGSDGIGGRTGDVLQGESTEAASGALEELAAGEDGVHGVVEWWSFERRKSGESIGVAGFSVNEELQRWLVELEWGDDHCYHFDPG